MSEMQTHFRVQTADRDPQDLLDPGWQFSSAYNRNPALTRRGVSTCATLDELAEYLTSGQAGAIQPRTGGTWVIVELRGEISHGAPVDVYETLIIPTEIVSVRPVDDEFMDLIAAKNAFWDSFVPAPDFD